ncbi:hypothetical protein EGY07_20250 [Chryseobacterium indologenes]|uniref:hypothetical protein n=1 Tax=Chryseobacterium indologenes TaxID=253 RepID=UPI000F5151D0|nr:hypothetical protein [Chryseobacterium indologenes]AYZ37707.1 hypothetical protein EGY07_20250 [Chryseobacterium indologenes]MBF6646597.1 hypothetical protein [Chryseobacterium indologenes]MBU3049548.1 hypothetical protein [Chryseobacterium indologenes]MEB4760445.1 hypothetical protein [Chryseobacterium indologenes]QQQ69740.1 hypothetical protein JHW31_14640 [Chryseobacterium indologenes]
MKSILLKTQKIVFIIFGFTMGFAQNSLKIPSDAVFYMEVNGKQLNNKINWDKLNPLLHELNKKSKENSSWTDYSKTGIKYDAAQYHYASLNDSIKTYNTHFIIDNKEKFQEFVNSIKKKGQEVSKKNNYSYVDINDDVFVGWNGSRAVLSMISYTKPHKDYWEADAVTDSTAVAVADGVAVDSVYNDEPEKPFDYKEEIKELRENIKYLKENIKDNNLEIARIQKDIKYLQKYHAYPQQKEDGEKYEEESKSEEAYEEENKAYQKEQDSIRREKFLMVKKNAEERFDQFFSSNFEIEVPEEMLAFRDANSDVFVYADYGRIVNDGLYGKMTKDYTYGQFFKNMYNSNYAYNLYFDKDKVRLVNNYQHKNSEIQKNISAIYKGKKNRKLLELINEKSVGYYAMNVNGAKCFDMMYSLLQNSGEHEYKKEMELIMETMKIVLDEEAIAKIAPGNGIFVLNELKSKTVEYTDYEYDAEFNEKEVKKTKEIAVPNFTFAFATENEAYWNRIFDVLATHKKLAKRFSKTGDMYTFKESKDGGYIDKLFFTVKDGVVYLMSSADNIVPVSQSSVSRKWAKDSAKYPLSGRLDIQKLLTGLDKEFKSPKERKTLEAIRKNVGELYYKTEVKGESIRTEMDYDIKGSSENSLMYFFDIFNQIFNTKEKEKKPQIL